MELIKIHATWGFLVETEELEEIDVNTFEEFWGDFYHNQYSDGDNWNLPMMIVHETGEIVPLCKSGAYRGTDFMWKSYQNIELDKRFERALKFLTSCIAIDFDVPGARGGLFTRGERAIEYDDLPRNAIMDDIKAWIPKRLQHLIDAELGNVSPQPDIDVDKQAYWDWYTKYAPYRQRTFVELYEQWLYAKEYDRLFQIFGARDNIRCGYRAMQLNDAGYWGPDDEHRKPVSIVFLDYHY